MECDVPMAFEAVQVYVPESFLSAFVIARVWFCTVALPRGKLPDSFVQDITGGGYPMTWHRGSLTSFPLSAYIGSAGRETSGRALSEKIVQLDD